MPLIRGVQKPKIGLDSLLLNNWTMQTFDISLTIFDRNCMQSAIRITSDKNNLNTCIQCGEVKNVLKHDWNRA